MSVGPHVTITVERYNRLMDIVRAAEEIVTSVAVYVPLGKKAVLQKALAELKKTENNERN